ncbi:MAG: RagB/SusD family nutrient uptake outer membrane protein [Tannerella sp.]|jgi:tetratricopeptide (TPR) repeat protein|nr:RagB/SusD family nutrient uptake outer membrane protein [Tannerella sp.]
MNIKAFFLSLILFSALSCEDFLDHPLTGSVSDDNIGEILQKDPAKLKEFLAGGYRSYGGLTLYARYLPQALATMSHEIDIDWLGEEGRNEFVKNSMTSVNSYVKDIYAKYYSTLSSLNLVLDMVDFIDLAKLSNSDADMVLNIKGEALFMRALVHFDLLRCYGEKGPNFSGDYPANKDAKGIILIDGPLDPGQILKGRSTVEETYQSILNDLLEAEKIIADNQIPANTVTPSPGYTDTDFMEDTRWAQKPAVYALLGKVYLYMQNFDEAKSCFEKIINDSRFKLDKPVNFTDYLQHRDNNEECIFSLQYYLASGSSYDDTPSHQLVRIFGSSPGGWKNYFITKQTCDRFGNDPRLYEATLYDHDWETSPGTWATATDYPVFATLDADAPGFRCWARKPTDFFNISTPRDCSKNLDIIRLADIYLMYAECSLRKSSPDIATATEYVNKVRRRAWGQTDYNTPGANDLATVDMAILSHERFKELFFENHRWFDLCRWGTLQDEIALYKDTGVGAPQYSDNSYYMPIPETEIKANRYLEQNRGY